MIATISFQEVLILILAVSSVVATGWVQAGEHQAALNYLLFSGGASNTAAAAAAAATGQQQTKQLQELLKDSNHSHVSDAVNLQLANDVWQRMRQNALGFAQQKTNEARPTINELFDKANVSPSCRQSINQVLDHLSRLDQWAVKSKYLLPLKPFF